MGDSDSYISPYLQSNHSWTGEQYDMTNETNWVKESAVDGYKIPITADDSDSFFAQKRSFVPDIVDGNGNPIHGYREHAWNDEGHWASNTGDYETDAPDGYRGPISGDYNTLAQQRPVSMAEA